jgi:flagellin
VSSIRGEIGAAMNRLSTTVANLATAVENLSAANSRIRDVDVAEETAQLTRHQILTQAGVAMLAQANQLPSVALALLRG